MNTTATIVARSRTHLWVRLDDDRRILTLPADTLSKQHQKGDLVPVTVVHGITQNVSPFGGWVADITERQT